MQSRIGLVKKLIKNMERVQSHLRSGQVSGWSGLDLTMPQVKTLFLLAEQPIRMRGIARRLGVEMPSATTMIDRLVAKGFGRTKSRPGGPAGGSLFRHSGRQGTQLRNSGPSERPGSNPLPPP